MYEYESGRESISAEGTLCFGAHRVWIRVRGGYVTFGWNYKPTPIETYRNPADRLCLAGIGSSDFHLADFGFGRLLRLSPLRSNFAECTFTVPTQFESRLYSTIFFRAGSIFNWNYILYTSFFIYTFKSTTPFIHKYGLQMAWSQFHNVVSINFNFQIFETTLCWNPMYAFLANCLQLMCVSCGSFVYFSNMCNVFHTRNI